ncbi:MAG TPA: sensor histidine kinase, partial [Acidimicrobiia bacterium]|nr:sensor histidine kinase [Acidimicrobiia bacterium]
VSDTGIGIPADEQRRVFERFWRGAGARGVAGSGIGLTVVSELAHAHGGDVRVESEPGQGTRVTVRIPSR